MVERTINDNISIYAQSEEILDFATQFFNEKVKGNIQSLTYESPKFDLDFLKQYGTDEDSFSIVSSRVVHYRKYKGKWNRFLKKAAIIYGVAGAGKSQTIKKCLKNRLGIGENDHWFSINGHDGYVYSQSFEEAHCDVDRRIEKIANLKYTVLACRPVNEANSKLEEVTQKLRSFGFTVESYEVTTGEPDDDIGKEVYEFLITPENPAKNIFK